MLFILRLVYILSVIIDTKLTLHLFVQITDQVQINVSEFDESNTTRLFRLK